jgi:hypothetical protein
MGRRAVARVQLPSRSGAIRSVAAMAQIHGHESPLAGRQRRIACLCSAMRSVAALYHKPAVLSGPGWIGLGLVAASEVEMAQR